MAREKGKQHIDKPLLFLTAALASVGFFIFTSASFGLFARKGFSLQELFFDQMILGLLLGIAALFIVSRIPLKFFRTYSLYFFLGSLVLSLLVWFPGLGIEHGGARRWIAWGGVSFQPSVLLNFCTVVYLAALLPLVRHRLGEIKYALGVAVGVLILPGAILLSQPDTGTFGVLFVAVSAMLLAAGMKIRHFLVLGLLSLLAVGILILARPYMKERILTFVDPSRDPQGAGYQIQKSLTAIGSGGITGRGFGQSIQKFGSLPEPTGDSVFAVASEEFGFIGGAGIILLFLLFGIRGLQIARRTTDPFGGLLAVGIVILIVWQSFVNIGAMLGVMPLTGVPLVFISHGGTALLFAFIQVGLLLNISKTKRI